VIPPASPFFSVHLKPVSAKIASGMEAVCTITFTPAANEDYQHDLVICTEREKFLVPVSAQGARAVLDLPDCIDFGRSCPCRSTSTTTILVSNKGQCSSAFNLLAYPPFSISPSRAFLNVGETLQLHVSLTPVKTGPVRGWLKAEFENGSESTAILVGSSVEIDVDVSPRDVKFVGTFVTKTTQQYFHIVNRTRQPIRYALKRFASQEEEQNALLAEGTPANSSDDDVDGALSARHDVFGTRAMSVFPCEGVVYPSSQMEVRWII
jgi:hydrocephalus-inducing protein